jgi:hypothetical protein
MVRFRLYLICMTMAVFVIGLQVKAPANDDYQSKSSHVIVLYIGQTDAYLNAQQLTLKTPPLLMNGNAYLALDDLPQLLGLKRSEQLEAKRVLLESEFHALELDFSWNAYFYNGEPSPFRQFVSMQNEMPYLQMKRLSRMFNFQLEYDAVSQKITIIYMPGGSFASERYKSQPIAKFRTGKSSYRMGEPIDFVNLSYSPTGQTIVDTIWQGRKNVYYEPGEYTVTLRVVDKNKQQSNPFSRKITVINETMYTPLQHFAHLARPGATFKLTPTAVANTIRNAQYAQSQRVEVRGRTLLVSDSPEDIREPGVLYEDRVAGKVRLFANHVNATTKSLRFAILLTNESNVDVQFTLSNMGESVPSGIANLNGKRALLDFMLRDHMPQAMLVPAGKTIAMAKLPLLAVGEGVNVIYDCDVADEAKLRYSFVAVPEETDFNQLTAEELNRLPVLAYRGHVRGTFAESARDIQMTIATEQMPLRLTIGDNLTDGFVRGYDPTRQLDVLNNGNFGVMYRISVAHSQRHALTIRARGGMFKGHLLIDGNIVFVPNSGILTPQDGLLLLHRTEREAGNYVIECSPPAGSAFPIDLVFLPLNDKIKNE